MRNIILTLAVLLIISGCGGGGHLNSGNSSSGVLTKGSVTGGLWPAELTSVSVYEHGYVGEADHLITTADIKGDNFEFRIPESGIYDIRIGYSCWVDHNWEPTKFDDTQDRIGLQISSPQTDIGEINLGLPLFSP